MKKRDIILFCMAYVGLALQTWWGIWSYGNYGVPFAKFLTFITSMGGLAG